MKELIGHWQAHELRVGIVVSRCNELITKRLLEGAAEGLRRHGIDDTQLTVAWVPGSFDIPLIAKKMASSGVYDVLLCLGAIIRGETSHADHIASQVAASIANIALDTEVPLIFGILTTDTLEQALARAGAKMGNKGFEAAQAAIEMAHLMRQLS